MNENLERACWAYNATLQKASLESGRMSRSLWYHFAVMCETLWSGEEKLQLSAIKKADTKPVSESSRLICLFWSGMQVVLDVKT